MHGFTKVSMAILWISYYNTQISGQYYALDARLLFNKFCMLISTFQKFHPFFSFLCPV